MLTDVVMPRMRGPMLAEQIVKQRPGIAVVFMSGYTEEVISQSCALAGFSLVEKPFTAETLLQRHPARVGRKRFPPCPLMLSLAPSP